MGKIEFKAESKRLLDLMVNSIYMHKEIFLRELISNASDALDKLYYKSMKDKTIDLKKEDLFIKIIINKEDRTIKVIDSGIGMNRQELEENLGTIAKSGSFAFKKENEASDDLDIIGQFGIGFYSAFMVADFVSFESKAYKEEKAYIWESDGIDGFTIKEGTMENIGSEITLRIKESSKDEDYDDFLEEYRIMTLIRKYSNFIRYPIKMNISKRREVEGSEGDYEDYIEEEIINSMVPIWRKNKNELSDEDYLNFYHEKHFGYDKPLKHIHLSMDGLVSYNSILYIPRKAPFDFYSSEYEKGLELYSSGVLIMDKCSELLPDYFSFIKGVVDSEDLSLNISREILQHDRQLKLIAKKIEEKIKEELDFLLVNHREEYEEFFESFGKQLKYGIYSNFGMNKEILEDLIIFYSSKEEKMVSLNEYLESMDEEQKYIYYARGESIERINKSPQIELIRDKGYDILYFLDEIDEFAIKILNKYKDKEFRSISAGDLGFDGDEKEEVKEELKENMDLFESMKEYLSGKVVDVVISKRLKDSPVCLTSQGDLTIDMEKTLKSMPNSSDLKADKLLEINTDHRIFTKLKEAYEMDRERFELYTSLLYDQALLIEGLEIEDPVNFSNNICQLM